MKRKHKMTMAEKRKKFRTIANWLREKEEARRKKEAQELDQEFKKE